MTNKPIDDAKDGFDLIEYPCDYSFKAMCKVTEGQSAVAQIQEIAFGFIEQDALLDIRSNTSRTGKFESVTLSIRLKDRPQLEAIYQAIASSPNVVMTL